MVNRVPLGEVCDFIRGVAFDGNEAIDISKVGYVPILRAGNIGDELYIRDDLVWVPEKRVSKEQLFQVGDIAICIASGSPAVLGKTAQLKENFSGSVGAFCGIIRPTKADPNYIAYWLKSPTFMAWRDSQANGVNIQNLRPNEVREIEIPLPPLTEQKRIASLLARADRLRHLRRTAHDLGESLLQSVFLEMFGDPKSNPNGYDVYELGEIGTLDRGRSKNRPRNAPELYGGKYPFIQTGDIANAGSYIKSYQQTYSELGLKQSKMWKAGTLCITIAANIAKTAILTFDACFPDSVVGFVPDKEKTNVEYVQYWLSFKQQELEDTAPESAQKNINLEILRGLAIPVPQLNLQEEFAGVVARVESLRGRMSEGERQVEGLFESLLSEAFNA